MQIEPTLKPLYANLKRLKIGKYLYTEDFELFILENDIDDHWKACKKEVNRSKRVVMLGHHDTRDEEEALILMLTEMFSYDYKNLHDFVMVVLLKFAEWSKTKLDFTDIIHNLKDIGSKKTSIIDFTRELSEIQKDKTLKIEGELIPEIKSKNTQHGNKIFVVHGKDDKSRLELCNILKNEFKLDPVVLQEEPNNSIETIISKFERLAGECSAAIILFTPDDDAGDNKRARQNVIFELGYFLGKFQDNDHRRIIILKKGDVEIPSDISGVLYLEYSKSVKELYYDLKKQFEHWNYTV